MMSAVIVALACIWLLLSFSILCSASITCMSCATKHAITHWSKFVNYRVMNSYIGTMTNDHSCENPQNLTCNDLCYIFKISGTSKVDGKSQLFAMAQGCSDGLFDGEVRCFDRPIIMHGRGGNFPLNGHYCLCDGELCNRNLEVWIEDSPKKFYAQRQKAGSMNRSSIIVIAISTIYLIATMKRLTN